MNLLERDEPLAALRGGVRSATEGRGSLILVGGQAGIGKTTLVRHVTDTTSGTVLLGACDPLDTPRPLGPLLDMVPDIVAGSPSRMDLLTAVLDLLSVPSAPRLAIFEDIHWADQATLDLLRFLGRRIDRIRTSLVITFRDDEAQPSSPLAVLLGDLATTPGVIRLTLAPLSRKTTEALVTASGSDRTDVFDLTGGNPFLVSALLTAEGTEVPASVREAVLARLSRVAPDTAAAVQAAAVLGPRVDPVLFGVVLDALGLPRWTISDGVATGLLRRHAALLEFRHELVRDAITQTIPPRHRQHLHGAIFPVLRAVRSLPEHAAELVAHAEGAGDDRAVVDLAPVAAEWAADRAAHREAAALYRKAVDRARLEHDTVLADLLEREATERYLSGDLESARNGHREAAAVFGAAGDRLRQGRNLVRVSALSFLTGAYADADPAANAVESVLDGIPPSHELAMAYDNQSRQRFMVGDWAAAASLAEHALAVAVELDDAEAELTARISLAGARLGAGDLTATTGLTGLVRIARAMRLADHAARGMFYQGWLPILHHAYDGLEPVLDQGLAFATRHGLGYWERLIAGARVSFLLDNGRWDEATPLALSLLAHDRPVTLSTMNAQAALVRVRARRGEREEPGLVEAARAMAARHPEADAFTLVTPALTEAAWLAGDPERVAAEVQAAADRGTGTANPRWHGELAYWSSRVGVPLTGAGPVPKPYRLAIAGDWAAAAAWWSAHGCPFETALALSEGDDSDAVRDAMVIFDRLAARPAAAHARRRLRELGVTRVPRGPRPETSANPIGLSRRESEVLGLVALGLTNTAIADRLVLSEKTVERHVSAVLRKTETSTRAEAVYSARRAGALPPI
ncbi:MAG: AAA family ATPase [Kutzneria sp.]|nr:AAA family ATPase [Kutzneria sp.]